MNNFFGTENFRGNTERKGEWMWKSELSGGSSLLASSLRAEVLHEEHYEKRVRKWRNIECAGASSNSILIQMGSLRCGSSNKTSAESSFNICWVYSQLNEGKQPARPPRNSLGHCNLNSKQENTNNCKNIKNWERAKLAGRDFVSDGCESLYVREKDDLTTLDWLPNWSLFWPSCQSSCKWSIEGGWGGPITKILLKNLKINLKTQNPFLPDLLN